MTGVRIYIPRIAVRIPLMAIAFVIACALALAILGAVVGDIFAFALMAPCVVFGIGWYFWRAIHRT